LLRTNSVSGKSVLCSSCRETIVFLAYELHSPALTTRKSCGTGLALFGLLPADVIACLEKPPRRGTFFVQQLPVRWCGWNEISKNGGNARCAHSLKIQRELRGQLKNGWAQFDRRVDPFITTLSSTPDYRVKQTVARMGPAQLQVTGSIPTALSMTTVITITSRPRPARASDEPHACNRTTML